MFVGTPNQIWLQNALEYVGYNIVYNEYISYISPAGNFKSRVIIVGKKIIYDK